MIKIPKLGLLLLTDENSIQKFFNKTISRTWICMTNKEIIYITSNKNNLSNLELNARVIRVEDYNSMLLKLNCLLSEYKITNLMINKYCIQYWILSKIYSDFNIKIIDISKELKKIHLNKNHMEILKMMLSASISKNIFLDILTKNNYKVLTPLTVEREFISKAYRIGCEDAFINISSCSKNLNNLQK